MSERIPIVSAIYPLYEDNFCERSLPSRSVFFNPFWENWVKYIQNARLTMLRWV